MEKVNDYHDQLLGIILNSIKMNEEELQIYK